VDTRSRQRRDFERKQERKRPWEDSLNGNSNARNNNSFNANNVYDIRHEQGELQDLQGGSCGTLHSMTTTSLGYWVQGSKAVRVASYNCEDIANGFKNILYGFKSSY
jgi:hypothetical protein